MRQQSLKIIESSTMSHFIIIFKTIIFGQCNIIFPHGAHIWIGEIDINNCKNTVNRNRGI